MAYGIKTGGRQKGTLNKDTSTIRNTFQSLIESNLEQIQNDLNQLEPKDRIKTILDLAKFVIPTMKATEFSVSENSTDVTPLIINFSHETN